MTTSNTHNSRSVHSIVCILLSANIKYQSKIIYHHTNPQNLITGPEDKCLEHPGLTCQKIGNGFDNARVSYCENFNTAELQLPKHADIGTNVPAALLSIKTLYSTQRFLAVSTIAHLDTFSLLRKSLQVLSETT